MPACEGKLKDMQPGSKAGWAKERQLQLKKQKPCSIPVLKNKEGVWMREPKDKANILTKCFGEKLTLPEAQVNQYTNMDCVVVDWSARSTVLSIEGAEKALKAQRR